MDARIERDELGEREIPKDALYGLQSLRAKENFSLGFRRTNPDFIRALGMVKKAAALSYLELEQSDQGKVIYGAIAAACDRLLSGEGEEDFITDALQGGAGTSTNMNVNEVLANMALEQLGKPHGDYGSIHPLDHVNRGQSTNDVCPTALRIAAIFKLRELETVTLQLQKSLERKGAQFAQVNKLGRTELMDAVPITLGMEFQAYAKAISRDLTRIRRMEDNLRSVTLGGGAVGTGTRDRDSEKYRPLVIRKLAELSGIKLEAAEDLLEGTQNNDVFAAVSGVLKVMAVNLVKIARDLRLMNSGPRGGLGEIKLAPLQKGSTIMPGKVNPVIPEMVCQCAMRVMANDQAVFTAAAQGEFELNAFFPLIADSLLESLNLLVRSVSLFSAKCIDLLEADRARCDALLESSCAFAASYTPRLGYDRVTKIVEDNNWDSVLVRQKLEEAVQELSLTK